MQLLQLVVKNWVHHRELTCSFTRGLVAILGENGSGKSSLFGAIRWALTGENPNFGVKSDNISQYAEEGEASNVSLTFEHNGHVAVVTRHLLPERETATLVVDGTEKARGDRAVTKGVEDLLGVDAKFISRFIIVGQTDIFSFIDDNQTETDKFFQRLFNTITADKCQDVIGKQLSALAVPEVLQTPAVLEAQKEETEKSLHLLEQKLSGLPDFDTFLSLQKKDQETIADWRRRKSISETTTKINEQCADYESQLKSVEASIAQYENDLSALSGATAGHDETYAAAREALVHWQGYKAVAKAKAELQASKEKLTAARDANQKPRDIDPERLAGLNIHKTELSLEAAEHKKFLKTFSDSAIAACPVCSTPTKNLMARISEVSGTLLPQIEQQLSELSELISEEKTAIAAYENWQKRDQELQSRVQAAIDSEKRLVALPPPQETEEELARVVNDYEEFVRVREEIRPLLDAAVQLRSKLLGSIEQLKQQAGELESELSQITVTEADSYLAEARLGVLERNYAERQHLERDKNELLFLLQQTSEEINKAIAAVEKAEKLRTWSAIAQKAREGLKSAPRLVAKRNLQKLEHSINELLQIFSVNFLVCVEGKESPSFVAEFFDGRRQAAQRLSIGQKTVLALAFRVAVNSMFAEEIGLLALDEPTASLDAPRIKALAPVLEKLRELSTAKGLQCLLVTHATTLSHLFESTINLAPPELRNVSKNI